MSDTVAAACYLALALLVCALAVESAIERKRQRWLRSIEKEQWDRWAASRSALPTDRTNRK